MIFRSKTQAGSHAQNEDTLSPPAKSILYDQAYDNLGALKVDEGAPIDSFSSAALTDIANAASN